MEGTYILCTILCFAHLPSRNVFGLIALLWLLVENLAGRTSLFPGRDAVQAHVELLAVVRVCEHGVRYILAPAVVGLLFGAHEAVFQFHCKNAQKITTTLGPPLHRRHKRFSRPCNIVTYSRPVRRIRSGRPCLATRTCPRTRRSAARWGTRFPCPRLRCNCRICCRPSRPDAQSNRYVSDTDSWVADFLQYERMDILFLFLKNEKCGGNKGWGVCEKCANARICINRANITPIWSV